MNRGGGDLDCQAEGLGVLLYSDGEKEGSCPTGTTSDPTRTMKVEGLEEAQVGGPLSACVSLGVTLWGLPQAGRAFLEEHIQGFVQGLTEVTW